VAGNLRANAVDHDVLGRQFGRLDLGEVDASCFGRAVYESFSKLIDNESEKRRRTAVSSCSWSCQSAFLSGGRIASGQTGDGGDVDDVRGVLVVGALEKEVFQAR
jgi:hypothetical protein